MLPVLIFSLGIAELENCVACWDAHLQSSNHTPEVIISSCIRTDHGIYNDRVNVWWI